MLQKYDRQAMKRESIKLANAQILDERDRQKEARFNLYPDYDEIFDMEERERKLIEDGEKISRYLLEKSQEVPIHPFFGAWIGEVCKKDGPQKFALSNILDTLVEKNMGGRVGQEIMKLVYQGGFS